MQSSRTQRSRSISILLITRCYTLVILICIMTVPFLPNSGRVQSAGSETASGTASNTSEGGPVSFGVSSHTRETGKQRTLAATHYDLTDGLSSSLILSNQGPRAFDVIPSLFSPDGLRLDVPTVSLKGAEVATFDIAEWAALGGAQFQAGSIQLAYEGKLLELAGVVQVADFAHSLIFDEELSELAPTRRSSLLDAVWWLPSPHAELRLVLTNTADTPLTANVSIDTQIRGTRHAEEITLAAHQSRTVNARDLLETRGRLDRAGGVSIKHDGPEDALLAMGLIGDAATGYSSVVEFTDRSNAKSSKLDGTGLRFRDASGERLKPVVVAHNVSDSLLRLSGRLVYTTAAGQVGRIELPEMRMDAGETRAVNLDGIVNRVQSEPVVTAGLEFEHTGEPGSVIVSAQGVSQSGNNVYRVPTVDARAQRSATGKYPWTIQESLSTTVYIKNTTDKAQQYFVQVNIARSEGAPEASPYVIGLKSLEAGETMSYDLRKIRDEQFPDANGNTIPVDATRGQFHWSVDGEDNLALIGRAEQADEARAMSTTSACTECCPDSFYDGFCNPGIIVGVPGDTNQITAFQRNVDCFGEVFAPFTRTPTWSSSSTTVATVTSGGLATAINPGTTNINASWTAIIWDIGFDGNICSKFFVNPQPFTTCMVAAVPRIREITNVLIDRVDNSKEVPECGRFQVVVEYDVSCPPDTHSVTIGEINFEGRADLITAGEPEVRSRSGDGEVCTTVLTNTYRMKNTIGSNTTGGATYRVRVTDGARTASEVGPTISIRNTIPGTGPCP